MDLVALKCVWEQVKALVEHRTQDCYIFQKADGDALVGRTVAQLQFTADEFDVLPPHR